ncbi:hypothetical protein, conserved [Plasmodium gonderi]|uniref:Uncharacterized protein n=1 Tax=Plasmodium gonderi TaxID=77519 RepID=A0A1Y1JGM0_PLAGO|nr:hypothetical protein, conserved [Plasmodium gonderi]GAW79583.1 hypothetical protein, conserved [Plasmodium gonderi]
MFFLYNKITSASTKAHEEKKDNSIDTWRNETFQEDENITKEKSNERNYNEEDDLFLMFENNEQSRENNIKEEISNHGEKKKSNIFFAEEKMSEQCFVSNICKQEEKKSWERRENLSEVETKGVDTDSNMNKFREHVQNSIDTTDSCEYLQQISTHVGEFDENGDDFFKIDQNNFSTFTFSASYHTKRSNNVEYAENSNDGGQINDTTNEKNKEKCAHSGHLNTSDSHHMNNDNKNSKFLNSTVDLKSCSFEHAGLEEYSVRDKEYEFEEFMSNGNITRSDDMKDENEEEKGEVKNGEVGNGEVGNGEVGNGEEEKGEVGNGEVGNGEVGNGEVGNGEEEKGDVEKGEVKNGEVKNGEVGNGEVGNGEVGNGEEEKGDVEKGEVKNGEVKNGEVGNGEVGNGEVGNGEEEKGEVEKGEVGNGEEKNDEEGNGEEEKGDVGNGKEEKDDVEKGEVKNGEVKNGEVGNGEVGNGEVGNGEEEKGEVGNGEVGNGEEGKGEVEKGEEENGEVENGEVGNGEVGNGEVGNGEEEKGEVGNGEVGNGEVGNGEVGNGEEEKGDVEKGEEEKGDVEKGEVKNGEVKNGEVGNGEVGNGEVGNGEVKHFEGQVIQSIKESEKNEEYTLKCETVNFYNAENLVYTHLEMESDISGGKQEFPFFNISEKHVPEERMCIIENTDMMHFSKSIEEDEVKRGVKNYVKNEVENDIQNCVKKDVQNEKKREFPNDPFMLDSAVAVNEDIAYRYFNRTQEHREEKNASHEDTQNGTCDGKHNGDYNDEYSCLSLDLSFCANISKEKSNYSLDEYLCFRNVNRKEEEEKNTFFENNSLEKLDEGKNTFFENNSLEKLDEGKNTFFENNSLEKLDEGKVLQNKNIEFESTSFNNKEMEKEKPRMEEQSDKKILDENFFYQKKTCEIGENGFEEKWEEENWGKLGITQMRNTEIDNEKKSIDNLFFGDVNEVYYEAYMDVERNGDETFEIMDIENSNEKKLLFVDEDVNVVRKFCCNSRDDASFYKDKELMEMMNQNEEPTLENKEVIEVVEMANVEEGKNGNTSLPFDGNETHDMEKVAKERKDQIDNDFYLLETVDLKYMKPNTLLSNNTQNKLEKVIENSEQEWKFYEHRKIIEGITKHRTKQKEEEIKFEDKQLCSKEMNELKDDNSFSSKQVGEIKTRNLISQTVVEYNECEEEKESCLSYESNKNNNPVALGTDDGKHILGENSKNIYEEMNPTFHPNILNEQFVQKCYDITMKELGSTLNMSINMRQENNPDERKGASLHNISKVINCVLNNDLNKVEKMNGHDERVFTEVDREEEDIMQIWNEMNEKEEIHSVKSYDRIMKHNGNDTKIELANEEIFEIAILNDNREKKKKKKKISVLSMPNTKQFKYGSGSLEYLKALRELPPLKFLKCKDLRPFLRLFNIVLKAVCLYHFNRYHVYVFAGDESGCVYVKLKMKYKKFCQEDETFMLANCCASVEDGHLVLEINEYSNIFPLKYNIITNVNTNINFSDAKFVTLSECRI